MHNCHGSKPQGCFCFNYVSPPKNRARSPQQSKPDYSFLAGEKGGESRGIKVRNFKEQRAHMKQRCSSEAFPGGRQRQSGPESSTKTFVSRYGETYGSSRTVPGTMGVINRGFKPRRNQCTKAVLPIHLCSFP